MKKVILLLLSFFLVGCNVIEKEKVKSIIEKENNLFISIHYPITNIPKLDALLKKDTHEIYENFKKEYESHYVLHRNFELNIDYTKSEINERYINVTLSVFLSSNETQKKIKTYVFDKKEEKLLGLEDVIEKEDWDTIKVEKEKMLVQHVSLDKVKESMNQFKETLFTFTDTDIILYENADEILSVSIPISKLHLKIPLIQDTFQEKHVTPILPEKNVIDPTKPVLALTFDDGPSLYTKEILNILKSYDACATFFVIGNKVEAYQDIIKESIQNGNEIGNHSYSHKDLSKLKSNDFLEEIEKTQEIIQRTTGYTPKLLRPTYGERNQRMDHMTNLKIVLWTVDPKDWSKKTSKQIINHILSKVKNEDIILLHDTKKRTVEVVKVIVPKLIEEGYQFVTMSELDSVKLLNRQ